MTLDELLALLPDNTTGQIGADDMRVIVTDLWNAAHTTSDSEGFAYKVSPPAAGQLVVVGGWVVGATALEVAETTGDGAAFPFVRLDAMVPVAFDLAVGGRASVMQGSITGPSVDNGTYRTVPISVSSVTGPPPSTAGQGTPVTLTILGRWGG